MLRIADADSAENTSKSKNFVIHPVACSLPDRPEGAPKLFGTDAVRIKAGSRLHAIYERQEIQEQYFCNYEVNSRFEPEFERAGLRIVAWGPQGEVRAVELPDHRFFLATLFQPHLSSKPLMPHPIVLAFLKEAAQFREAALRPSLA